ncbi:MAG: hypothetical protein GVY30_09260 [Chloroflexi bacterium]|jgi:hypothetical protein|nr:hypothetical protein [Chloroflexota bacterium]
MKKKYILLSVWGLILFSVLLGCLGGLGGRPDSAQQGLAESRFESYTQLIGAEKGISIIEINNRLSKEVTLKITLLEEEDAWKEFVLAGQETLRLELGATNYVLEVCWF